MARVLTEGASHAESRIYWAGFYVNFAVRCTCPEPKTHQIQPEVHVGKERAELTTPALPSQPAARSEGARQEGFQTYPNTSNLPYCRKCRSKLNAVRISRISRTANEMASHRLQSLSGWLKRISFALSSSRGRTRITGRLPFRSHSRANARPNLRRSNA